VVRASVMATIALIAVAIGRPSAGLQVLSVTVWFLLAIDPWRAVDIAFGLSVAATAGIVLGFGPATRLLERVLPRWLAMAVALPLVAQIAVQPVVILLRPTIPLYGVIANLLAAPFVPFVTIAGLAGALATPISPAFAGMCAALGWYPATAIASIARAVAALPYNELPWLTGVPGVGAALLVSAGWWLMFSGRIRVGAFLALVTFFLVSVLTMGPRMIATLTLPRSWDVAQCDVGQGDALIVNTSSGYFAIDTGNNAGALTECLSLLRISRVRWLVLTHFDVDHVGQSGVYRSRVDMVLTGPTDNGEDEERLADLERSGATIGHVNNGDVIDAGTYRVHVVWPESAPLGEAGNDSSVTVLMEPVAGGEGLSLLALGDLGESAQQMMMPRLPRVPVDVVKVSHHGSPDQYDDLYFSLRAPLGLIGVGAHNSYGHPAPQTLSMLRTSGTLPLRSDLRGTILLSRTPEGISVWSQRDD
jgi:competence protein ComEC